MARKMRRRYITLAASAVFVAAGGVAAAVAASGASPSRAAPARWSRRPPQPRLTTLGVTRSAVLVSYCWAYRDRPGTSVCADGSLAGAPPTLRWRPRALVRLDLLLPAHDVGVVASHQSSARDGRVTRTRLDLHRVDSAGAQWVFQIPAATKDNTDVLISATFAQGDIFAEVGLRADS